jgi:hypothetical protein
MSDAERSWWLDAHRTWRRGTPPEGWRQAGDGRWHPPHRRPDDTTEELAVLAASRTAPVTAPTHMATAGPPRGLPVGIGLGALVAVVLLAAAGVLVAVSTGSDRRPSPSPDEIGAPAGVPAAGRSTSTSSPTPPAQGEAPPGSGAGAAPDPPVTTTGPATTTTAPSPDPPDGDDPLDACTAGQRNMIERGNHPWEWYLARFDEDGDGILCT